MRESVKVTAVVVLMVSLVVAALGWLDAGAGPSMQMAKWIATATGIASLVLFAKLHFTKDLAPDFLKAQCGNYFNRGGFAFAVDADAVDGILYVRAWFQNQFERPCQGRIALRPGRGFFLDRPDVETICFNIECGCGSFGVASVPVPLSQSLQGKTQAFEVGASVEYPDGKGRQVRFHDGLLIRTNSAFKNHFGRALTAAGAVGGAIVISRPATVKIKLPRHVAETLSEHVAPTVTTLWTIGDAVSQVT